MNLAQSFAWVNDGAAWVGLLSLVALEIVLGVDNIVFISILAGRLPKEQQGKARKVGLILALIPRVLLLLAIGWVLSLERALFELPFGFLSKEGRAISGQDIIVIVGGLFLLYKATHEIHEKLEGEEEHNAGGAAKQASYVGVLVQISLLNIVFSLDSVITAIGMVKQVSIMVIAVLIATAIMALAVNPVSRFVEKHPTVKMLALSFLLLIGMTLIAEGLGLHIPKGYVYFAMGFSVLVEMLNLLARRKSKPVELHQPYRAEAGAGDIQI